MDCNAIVNFSWGNAGTLKPILFRKLRSSSNMQYKGAFDPELSRRDISTDGLLFQSMIGIVPLVNTENELV